MLTHRNTILAMMAATALTVPGLAAAQDASSDRAGMTKISCEQATEQVARAVDQSQRLSAADKRQARQNLEKARNTDSRTQCLQHVRAAHDTFAEVEAVLIMFGADGNAFTAGGAGQGSTGQTFRTAANGGQIVVEQPDPQVSVQTTDPKVTVDQKRPQVTVRQPQPEVIVRQQKPTVNVRQPAPVVTVQQAQPDITVNIPKPIVEIEMPKPDVNVASVEPTVNVSQPKPKIRFVRPEPEIIVEESKAQVDVEAAKPQVEISEASNLAADVNIDRAKPEVRFQSSGEADVNVQQGKAKVRVTGADNADVNVEQEEAEVRFEETDGTAGEAAQQRQQQQAIAEPQQASERERLILAMRKHPMYGSRVDELVGDDVYSANGEDVGEVEQFAIRGDQIYAIVGVGGFLGIGDQEVALPIDRLAFAADRVTLPHLTENDLEAMRDVDMDRYTAIPMNQTLRTAYENR